VAAGGGEDRLAGSALAGPAAAAPHRPAFVAT
jgi:hypothetical protein